MSCAVSIACHKYKIVYNINQIKTGFFLKPVHLPGSEACARKIGPLQNPEGGENRF